MIPIDGQPILTAAQVRAAEARAIAAGTSVETLMERAGTGVAEAVRRLAAGSAVQILCGPGNNGGDGYVAARVLRANGVEVRVAATGEPKSAAASAACAAWDGPVAALADAEPAPVMVDALFGTGLSRAPDAATAAALGTAIAAARLSIAVDLPSRVDTDTGAVFAEEQIGAVDVTLALGAVKPSHLLMPAAPYGGEVRVIDLGLTLDDPIAHVMARPGFLRPQVDDHKYSRGLVVVIGGGMPGAARLAAAAAAHGGAGYVTLLGDDDADAVPHAIVGRPWSSHALRDVIHGKRNNVVVVGPGLGRDETARERLAAAIASGERLVVDGDALHLLDDTAFAAFAARDDDDVVLTPHAGEFQALFGDWRGSKIDAALAAAKRAGATVVFKGPDTVVATRHGEAFVSADRRRWLSTAGTGDVLAGTVAAAMVSIAIGDPAAAAVWMHAEAARRLGGAFLADDLARELSPVRAAL
ncbi:MAG: NAD(P)H-hydrate epimerase [Sphingomonas sp.]|uniref:NAD(P)H-hydrate epimerase n=1 Tax=Sphingomonas sp. TaxID=28214 RepID=UPI001AC03B11|nr:NAD(P)H-hydrate epimerase [Sphingomonas sp.]MBN8807488.1 NAD(P)H-hydrate epimerase [Sphingomonas sp.]